MSQSDGGTRDINPVELEGFIRAMPRNSDPVEVEYEEFPSPSKKAEAPPKTKSKGIIGALFFVMVGLVSLFATTLALKSEWNVLTVPVFGGTQVSLAWVAGGVSFLVFFVFFVWMSPDGRTDGTYVPEWMKRMFASGSPHSLTRVTAEHHRRLKRYRKWLFFYHNRYRFRAILPALLISLTAFHPLLSPYFLEVGWWANVEQALDFCTMILPLVLAGGVGFWLVLAVLFKLLFRRA